MKKKLNKIKNLIETATIGNLYEVVSILIIMVLVITVGCLANGLNDMKDRVSDMEDTLMKYNTYFTSTEENTVITDNENPIIEIPDDAELTANIYDVRMVSNATVEELNLAIQNSCKWMYEYNPNLGQFYYDMEQEYGINAYFAISVSINEVGAQVMSPLAINHNNIYGLNMTYTFESIENCIEYFFNLIDRYYIEEGRITVSDISQKYCLGNPDWVYTVSYYMEELPLRSIE